MEDTMGQTQRVRVSSPMQSAATEIAQLARLGIPWEACTLADGSYEVSRLDKPYRIVFERNRLAAQRQARERAAAIRKAAQS